MSLFKNYVSIDTALSVKFIECLDQSQEERA
jgi:hypothetical protein